MPFRYLHLSLKLVEEAAGNAVFLITVLQLEVTDIAENAVIFSQPVPVLQGYI